MINLSSCFQRVFLFISSVRHVFVIDMKSTCSYTLN